ncbi:MAG: hypothetical protein Tsb002_20670 [Wenzhouxiangellaceae bacterium]
MEEGALLPELRSADSGLSFFGPKEGCVLWLLTAMGRVPFDCAHKLPLLLSPHTHIVWAKGTKMRFMFTAGLTVITSIAPRDVC